MVAGKLHLCSSSNKSRFVYHCGRVILMDLFANPTLLDSRSALKKYILANNKNIAQGATFDTQFNRAIKAGVEKGEFAQPKGGSLLPPHLDINELSTLDSVGLMVDLIVYVYWALQSRQSCCCRGNLRDLNCFDSNARLLHLLTPIQVPQGL